MRRSATAPRGSPSSSPGAGSPTSSQALAATTGEALARFPEPDRVRLMFTAHSLPAARRRRWRRLPGRAGATVAAGCGRGCGRARRYDFAYQSAGRTDEPWLGPEILAEIRRLAAEGVTELVVSPVGFIADHLEVLYDIDIEAQGVARPLGIRLERPRMLNDDPHLVSALAGIVERTLPPADAARRPRPPAADPRRTPWTRPRQPRAPVAAQPAPPPTGRAIPAGIPGGHPGAIPGAGSVRPTGYVFDRAPMMLYWEMTRSCGLVCRHCRAEANAERHPDELTTAEGEALLDRVLGFGNPMPHVVFTGGDPLRRPDLPDLVRAARARGIGASLAPGRHARAHPRGPLPPEGGGRPEHQPEPGRLQRRSATTASAASPGPST